MIRVVSAYGFPFAHQPYWSPRGLSFVAESLFFLKVFGLSSIAMGSAMLLSAASAHWTWPTDLLTVGRALESSDDPYLKIFAAGPGCDWYIPPDEAGNVRGDGKKNAHTEDRAGC
jgi:hypothetical protein